LVEPTRLPRLQGLPPVLAPGAKLLVLGSFPGVASLRSGQYYGHPRNHFWPILSALWSLDLVALPYAQRLAEMQRRGLGLWDVYASCCRSGSLDSAIVDAEWNDFATLRNRAPGLRVVAHNGGESARAPPPAGTRLRNPPPAVHQPGQRKLVVRAQAGGVAAGPRRLRRRLNALPAASVECFACGVG
jgi:hypoxanthine-DNA glycosylase